MTEKITISSSPILNERLRQARISFNLACCMSVLSALVGFSGPILILSGYVKPGIASTAGGSASGGISFYWMRLAKDANDRLDKLSASHDRNALKE